MINADYLFLAVPVVAVIIVLTAFTFFSLGIKKESENLRKAVAAERARCYSMAFERCIEITEDMIDVTKNEEDPDNDFNIGSWVTAAKIRARIKSLKSIHLNNGV